ncbi:MAG: D-serine ammonia-lyase [Promethearchaeota archaeon]
MDNKVFLGEPWNLWKKRFPMLEQILKDEVVFWFNSKKRAYVGTQKDNPFTATTLQQASERFTRFSPLLTQLFPELSTDYGKIDSPLISVPQYQQLLEKIFQKQILGKIWIKGDHALPISGSIKARGGFYAVLKYAETLALQSHLLHEGDNYLILSEPKFTTFFHKHTLVVGSTGNLGLSIGIMGQKLGFQVEIHMSQDAKPWKKDLLKHLQVQVVEHPGNYSDAVHNARREAAADPLKYFIDDENSEDLFMGYAVGAIHLKEQLNAQNIIVDEYHSLMVYLPCGVGGAPGGITWGLKTLFGDNVHCFFAEPSGSPSMLLGLMTDKHDGISVQDFGMSGRTIADGLAVGRPSKFVGKTVGNLVSGIYTLNENHFFAFEYALYEAEQIKIEPSAAAGLLGPIHLIQAEPHSHYLETHGILDKLENITHVCWTTGGAMVPDEIMDTYLLQGKQELVKLN